MNPRYRQFIFENYTFDAGSGRLNLHYSLDGDMHFAESYHFDFPLAVYDPVALDSALQTLFFIAGVSYYKTYAPPEIVIKNGQLDAEQASFFSKTYQRGLGEFWFINELDPHTPVTFPTTQQPPALATNSEHASGMLVAIGGGKDSLVTIEALRGKVPDLSTWSLNHREQLTPLVQRIGLPHYWVEREWDTQLLDLNAQGALNGHIPISAIFACVGAVVAILAGKQDVVVSNEQSANEPTLTYQGVAINHQYSKSQEFEQDYQAYLAHTLGQRVRYYSFLRPLSEVRIGELFSKDGFAKYKDVFSSCNRAFVHNSHRMTWCGECAKCAFVCMALAPFVPEADLTALWSGKNLLLDPNLELMYQRLLGIEGDKPLDCVGDVKESRCAMRLASEKYPPLAEKYQFDIPADYDFRAAATHQMPPEIYELLTASLASQ